MHRRASDSSALRDRWWSERLALAHALDCDRDMLARMDALDAELLAAAPSSPDEDREWPGGWVLLNEDGHEIAGPGLRTAWPTEQGAATAATILARPVRPRWAPVSTWGGVQLLDARYWGHGAPGRGGASGDGKFGQASPAALRGPWRGGGG